MLSWFVKVISITELPHYIANHFFWAISSDTSLKKVAFLLHFTLLLHVSFNILEKTGCSHLETNSSKPVPGELTIATLTPHIPIQSRSRQAGARWLDKVGLLAPKNTKLG